ncbi:MAG: AAA family ATPase [Flavipsychrobacter sp.]|nr:AAA family ATPase [Flavipsychrobacter sp.]
MIKKLTVSHYKSLGTNTEIDLDNITVFVGQNGSGKSNIIDVFKFISDAMRIGLEGAITKRHGIKAVRKWSSGKPNNISIRLDLVEPTFTGYYQFDIGSHSKHEYTVKHESANITYSNGHSYQYTIVDQNWAIRPDNLQPNLSPLTLALPLISGDERFKPLENALRNISIYNIYPDTLRAPQKYDPSRPMEEHGINWVSILKDQDTTTWKDDLIRGLSKLTGEIDDVEIKQISGYLLTRFRHGVSGESKKAKFFESTQESDGTLRVAGIITALLQTPILPLIGIEEPELTIHPGAVGLIYDYIIQASRHSQILITTHSPEVLDCFNNSDVIRVVSKRNSTSIVSKMKEEQIGSVKSGLLTLGELHRTEGIEGVGQLSFFE